MSKLPYGDRGKKLFIFFLLLIMFCHIVSLLKPTLDVRGEHKRPISHIVLSPFLTNEAFALAPKHFWCEQSTCLLNMPALELLSMYISDMFHLDLVQSFIYAVYGTHIKVFRIT